MSIAHSNISIFVPHIGCPHRCSFCNQIHITGQSERPTKKTVEAAVNTAVNSKNYNPNTTELAFFGGSFTAIEPEYRLELLRAGYEFVKNGTVSGIRLSTRPDAISPQIISELKRFGVTAVELGAQSMDNTVLKQNFRGHTAEDVASASELIKKSGISLGLQLMTGLFGDTDEKALESAKKIADLRPDTVRIYPTIVLENTYLCKLYRENKYTPQTVEQTVELAGKILQIFNGNNINVIRLGLHSIDEAAYVAGPWHPAFGELCQSRLMYNIIFEKIKNLPQGCYNIEVNPKLISKAIGQHRGNIKMLSDAGYNCRIVGNSGLDNSEIKIKNN